MKKNSLGSFEMHGVNGLEDTPDVTHNWSVLASPSDGISKN